MIVQRNEGNTMAQEDENKLSQSDFRRTSQKRGKVRNTSRKDDTDRVQIPRDTEKGFPLVSISEEYYNFNDLVVSNEVRNQLEQIVHENRMGKKLRSYGLRPKQKVLFCGPPGTGKTLSARIISTSMGHPFVYVLFDAIMSSYLGETANNLRKIFDFIEKGTYVVLFDEFDIVGKKRDDPHEHGEIKRVVNNFMQMIDNFRGDSILIAATNHQHLLDKAMWRRFDDIVLFELPNTIQREQLFTKYLKVLRRSKEISTLELAKTTEGFSPADIAQVCQEALRRTIVQGFDIVTYNDIQFALKSHIRRKEIIRNSDNV